MKLVYARRTIAGRHRAHVPSSAHSPESRNGLYLARERGGRGIEQVRSILTGSE